GPDARASHHGGDAGAGRSIRSVGDKVSGTLGDEYLRPSGDASNHGDLASDLVPPAPDRTSALTIDITRDIAIKRQIGDVIRRWRRPRLSEEAPRWRARRRRPSPRDPGPCEARSFHRMAHRDRFSSASLSCFLIDL